MGYQFDPLIFSGLVSSGTSGGGSGANTSLSNLTNPTALNQDLIFSNPAIIQTESNPISGESNPLTIQTGDVTAGKTDALTLKSGSGLRPGNIFIQGGNSTGAFLSGALILSSGNNSGSSGSGRIDISTGSSAASNSGGVNITTGNVNPGHFAGDIILLTGNDTGSGRGDIRLENGTEGNAGDVWTSTDSQGAGAWVTPSSGVNFALSNLTNPTAINQDLLPGIDDNNTLGSQALGWAGAHIHVLSDTNGAASILTYERNLRSSTGALMFDWSTNGTLDAKTNLISNVVDPANPQDAATKNYVDNAPFANQSLSNLTPTAINQDLIFDDADHLISTPNDSGSNDVSGAITLSTGTTVNGASGLLNVVTGTPSGTGTSGNVNVGSGISTGGASGNLNLSTGIANASSSGSINLVTGATGTIDVNSGSIAIATGTTSGAGISGALSLVSGDAPDSNTGGVLISSGASNAANTGEVDLLSGNVNAAGASSGPVNVRSGNTVDGDSGSVSLVSGDANGVGGTGNISLVIGSPASGSPGKIQFQNGSEGIAGQIWTSIDTHGAGHWAAAPSTGANTALSNLASVAINTSLLPGTTNVIDLGSSSKQWANVYLGDGGNGLQLYNSGNFRGFIYPNFTSPSGVANVPSFIGFTNSSSSNPVLLGTQSNAGATASGTGNVLLETGNKTAGTGNSGSIKIRLGTSAGGIRGKFVIADGSEGTAGNVWTSTDVNGSGAWVAAGTSAEADLGTLTWSAVSAPSGTIVKKYRYTINSRQVSFLAKITATVAGTTVTSVSFPLPVGMPIPATWTTQESGGLIVPGDGSIATSIGNAVSGSSGIYDDGAGGYVIKIFDTSALNASDALCSLVYNF